MIRTRGKACQIFRAGAGLGSFGESGSGGRAGDRGGFHWVCLVNVRGRRARVGRRGENGFVWFASGGTERRERGRRQFVVLLNPLSLGGASEMAQVIDFNGEDCGNGGR